MNLISAYVAVGTISFVKNGFSYGFCSTFQNSHQNQIYAGERHTTGKHPHEEKLKADLGGNSEKERKPEVDELNEQTKDFFEGFRQIKNIYFECKTKINKRLKRKAKSPFKLGLKGQILSLYQCVKIFSLRSLDEILKEDFIPITDYAFFIRDGINITDNFSTGRTAATGHSEPLKDYAIRVLSQGWTALMYDRIENLLRTHSLKFQTDRNLIPKGRSRRRDHRMFAILVMGFIIMASILIPMGFQFLTVLGGKSLLLAKLALIMSAINGLKKIATSNVGYGFYHTGSDGHHHDHIHHGFHEKQYHVNPQNYNSQGTGMYVAVVIGNLQFLVQIGNTAVRKRREVKISV